MKSVGEVMAIGRTFKEALQKGIRSLETGRKAPSAARMTLAELIRASDHAASRTPLGYVLRLRSRA